MLPNYDDIRLQIDRDPDWFDGSGVPRYAPFTPDMLGVYDRFALLVEIECQACEQAILVGDGWSNYDQIYRSPETFEPYTLAGLAERYGYGDPPWHGCPGAGESMSSSAVRIVEAWERNRMGWERRPDVESIDVTPEWIKEQGA